MSGEIIVRVHKKNWATLIATHVDGRCEEITNTTRLNRRLEDRHSQFFYAQRTADGRLKLGAYAPWQGSGYGAAATPSDTDEQSVA